MPVPRFFFDTFDGDQTTVDSEGIECASLEDVEHKAVDALPDMARDLLPDGPNRLFRVHVRDEGGNRVFQATLELRSQRLTGRRD